MRLSFFPHLHIYYSTKCQKSRGVSRGPPLYKTLTVMRRTAQVTPSPPDGVDVRTALSSLGEERVSSRVSTMTLTHYEHQRIVQG